MVDQCQRRVTVPEIIHRLASLNISEHNGPFQTLVAEHLAASGRPLDDLTVRELDWILWQASVEFNAAFFAAGRCELLDGDEV